MKEENKTCETILSEVGGEQSSQWDYNGWTVVAGVEFLLIVLLLVLRRRNLSEDKKRALKREIVSEEVDFGNILDSAFNSGVLYDKLKVKCHPDLFVSDEEKTAIANELFQEITKNKNNIKKLHELRIMAEQKLNIKI